MTAIETRLEQTSILYVEDDPGARETLASILRRRFREVHTASGREEALSAFSHFEPDVILLDLVLGAASGLDLAWEMKQASPSCRILVLTGRADKSNLKESIRLGVDDFIEKPVDADQLLSSVERVAREARSERDLAMERELLQEYRQAMDLSCGVLKMTPAGSITYANSRAALLLGVKTQQLLGERVGTVLREYGGVDVPGSIFRTVVGGASWRGTIAVTGADGKRTLACSVMPVLDSGDNVMELIAICFDISRLVAN